MIPIGFSDCFSRRKVSKLLPLLPRTLKTLDSMAPWREGRWPNKIRCMTDAEIVNGRARGAGHGYTVIPGGEVWLNPHLSWQGMHLVLIHEWCHHAWSDADENEINSVLLPAIYKKVTGKKLDMDWAREQGIGPPCPTGDRGFVGELPEDCPCETEGA